MKRSLPVLLTVFLFGCTHQEEAPPKPLVTVKVARAETADVQLTIEAPASIYPQEQASISSKVTAPIQSLLVKKGDTVAAGQLIARVANHDLVAQRTEALDRARSDASSTEAMLAQAQKNLERRQKLYEEGAITSRELLASQTEATQARANYDVTHKYLDLLQGAAPRESSGGDPDGKARTAFLNAQLGFTEIHSPFAGVVTEQFLYAGDMAKPDSPIFTLMDLSVAVARAQVPEGQSARVTRGQVCSFESGNLLGRRPSGRVSMVNQAVDPASRTVEVWCEIPNPQRSLKAGVFGSVTVVVGKVEHATRGAGIRCAIERGEWHGHRARRRPAARRTRARSKRNAHGRRKGSDCSRDRGRRDSGYRGRVWPARWCASDLRRDGRGGRKVTSRVADFVQAHGRGLVLVILSFALAGVLMIPAIPISIFPQTDFPRVVILVDNGIAPVNVQMLTVTRPLEEAIRLVPGITTMRSVTGRGSTEINVFFRWDVDILNALHLVQGRISQITPNLPPGVRFYVNRLTFSVFPMVGFSVTSQTRTLADLWDLTYYNLAPRLYRLPGVAETRIVGGRPPEYHILVDPHKLNGYGMPLTKVVDAIRSSNIIQPAGMVQENYHLYLTTVTGLLESKEQVEDTVVDVVKGTPILVKDLAHVVPGERPIYNIVTANGRPAVLVNVLQQPDGNAVQIADAVNGELRDIRKTLPPDIQLSTYYDQSILVRESISGVTESIVIGLLLSVGVLLCFLKNWRTTIVAAIVIPIATLIAIVFMQLFHMSFNLMTLGGLAACIGVVIDDAIVMVENIMVHLSMGKSPMDAAKTAIQELTPALIGSTLTPIVVFVPLVFLGGITAVFFRALAMTLVTALFASLILAIFFTPVLAGLFLKPRAGRSGDRLRASGAGGRGADSSMADRSLRSGFALVPLRIRKAFWRSPRACLLSLSRSICS